METDQISYFSTGKCPECGGSNFTWDYKRAETICSECGLVIQEKEVDGGYERRAFNREEEKERIRTGIPGSPLMHDKGLSTNISPLNRDALGEYIPDEKRAQIYRMRIWQKRCQIYSRERSLSEGIRDIELFSAQLELSRLVKEEAAIIFRKAWKKNLLRGRSITGLAGVALYIACRIRKIPKTVDEFLEKIQVKKENLRKKNFNRYYRFLIRKLNLRLPLDDPLNYVSKIAQKIDASSKTQLLTFRILNKAKKAGITGGKTPLGLVAAALYIAGLKNNERRNQRDISRAADVTDVTLRSRYKELVRKLKISIPNPKIYCHRERKISALFLFK